MWIEQHDSNLLTDLFEIDKSQYNEVINGKQKKTITEGVSIQYFSHYACASVDIPSWWILSIEIGKNVVLPIAVSILAKYLYSKLKDKKESKIMINNQPVEINAEKINQLIINNINIYVKQEEKGKTERINQNV